MEPRSKDWMLATARGDYHAIARLLREEPRLARRRVSQNQFLMRRRRPFLLLPFGGNPKNDE